MNWINLNVTVIDSEEFLGADPVERATWLCLLRYCIGQENGGRIEGAKAWKDRKWQQVVRVTAREVMAVCDLWEWDGDDLVVAFYPSEKELEVQHLRSVGKQTSEAKRAAAKANGAKGGRPPKKTEPEPTSETQETHGNPSETHRKEGEGEGEGEGKNPLPLFADGEAKPLCTLQQAIAQAPMARMSVKAAEHWWHTRNSAGWTKGSTGGGAPRRITSWQSDMATSREWAEDAVSKASQPKNSDGKPIARL